MAAVPRLNGVIKAFEEGQPAFISFSPSEIGTLQAIAAAPYDGMVFEMEHVPYDIWQVRNNLAHILDRRRIAEAGSIAPPVAPMIRIPPNGSEMNQWIAKQVLDAGVYGIVWPHISTVAEARNAVSACRYPRPQGAPYYDPPGCRGDAPIAAARYWGLSQQDYYARADVWPLNPQGEILCIIMIEEMRGVENLPDILAQVPGIGAVIIGEGDLSQDLGVPRQYDHPAVHTAVERILEACHKYNVPCGMPHANVGRVEDLLKRGFRLLMTAPERSFNALNTARRLSGRA